MTPTEDHGIVVSRHCLDRLRERCPDLDLERRDPTGLVYYEVREALRRGRYSSRKPRWAIDPAGVPVQGRDSTGRRRFVWNADESRCYVLIRARRRTPKERERREQWNVATMYAARPAPEGFTVKRRPTRLETS